MSSSTPLTIRVIPGAAPEHTGPAAPSQAQSGTQSGARLGAATSSYASLLRRRRSELDALRAAMLDVLADPEDNSGDPGDAGTQDGGADAQADAQTDAPADAQIDLHAQDALRADVVEAAAPPDDRAAAEAAPVRQAVARSAHTAGSGLTNEDVRFAHVAEYLLNRAADFCGDRAVQTRGNWQMQIQIDPAILPGCSLQLSLSPFELMLRFDTTDVTSKTLISRHTPILKQRLAALLTERGTPREVEIVGA
jgi:type III secretion control protein HpaP